MVDRIALRGRQQRKTKSRAEIIRAEECLSRRISGRQWAADRHAVYRLSVGLAVDAQIDWQAYAMNILVAGRDDPILHELVLHIEAGLLSRWPREVPVGIAQGELCQARRAW